MSPDPIEAAYGECEAVARAHHENFPVVSRFLPKARRHHLWAIYTFSYAGRILDPELQTVGSVFTALALSALMLRFMPRRRAQIAA